MTDVNSSSNKVNPIVLMYHGTPDKKPSSNYSIQASGFLAHLNYLKKHAWHTAVVSDLNNPEALPDKTVILTFDDGYADNYAGAFLPLLKQGMKATWFITTHCIDKYADWMGPHTVESKMLSADQLREMAEHGMEVASHTCSHPDMSVLPYSKQLEELRESKETLESIISKKISSFAYPYGRYNQDSIEAVKLAGYTEACTVRSGFYREKESPLLIRRVTIFDTDTVSILARKLVFADNDVSLKNLSKYYFQRLRHRVFNET